MQSEKKSQKTKKSEQTYKIEFNHKEMKNIEFFSINDLLEKELRTNLQVKYDDNFNDLSRERASHRISALSTLIRNFERLEKEFKNEIQEVA
tara:strand:- start:44 stop:319 length:276 start_codon:yes stop_codon:yes gene_type:complete